MNDLSVYNNFFLNRYITFVGRANAVHQNGRYGYSSLLNWIAKIYWKLWKRCEKNEYHRCLIDRDYFIKRHYKVVDK